MFGVLVVGLHPSLLLSTTVLQPKLESISIRELPLMQGGLRVGGDLPNPFLLISSMVFIH